MLGSSMGMGMAPELWPQGLDQKSTHTTLISIKTEEIEHMISGLKAKMAVGGRDSSAFLYRYFSIVLLRNAGYTLQLRKMHIYYIKFL